MVVPVDKTIVVQVTAADVIHSWTIPAFGVKQDGVPGRIAELWFKAEKQPFKKFEVPSSSKSWLPDT